MTSVSSSTRSRTRAVISPRRYGSILTPAASMSASTPTRGSSISRNSRSRPVSSRRGRCACATRQVSAARVAAAASGGGPSASVRPSIGAGQQEQLTLLLGALRGQQVGGHGGIEAGAARRGGEAGLGLGVVDHGVRGQQPQGGELLVGHLGGQHELAAVVHGHGRAALAGGLDGHGRLALFEHGGQGAQAVLEHQLDRCPGHCGGGRHLLAGLRPDQFPQPPPQRLELVLLAKGLGRLQGQAVAAAGHHGFEVLLQRPHDRRMGMSDAKLNRL